MPELNRVIWTVAFGAIVASIGACSTAQQQRPVLATSAVEASAVAGGSSDLDFFDTLETTGLVCQDDVLHAALLLGNGESAATYADRVALARRLGYIGPGFDRPAHEAATLGEVAQVFGRVADGGAKSDRLSQEQAMARMGARGLLPAEARPYQGLTGAQLLTVMGGMRTAMGDRERAHIRLTDAAAPEATPPAPVTVAPSPTAAPAAPNATPSPMESPASPHPAADASAVASADGSVGAKAEPLPPSATDAALERESTPAAAPAASPAKPRVWVQGTPLRKPGK